MGHHAAGGDPAGDKYRYGVNLKENLQNQDRQGDRADVPAGQKSESAAVSHGTDQLGIADPGHCTAHYGGICILRILYRYPGICISVNKISHF